MLTVILKILSILGILLLVLLGVLFSAILLVLFVPVTYRVRADRQETVPDGDGRPADSPLMHIAVKADWLLGVLRVRFMYPDPGTVKVKALCFTLFDSGAGHETTETRKKTAEQRKPSEQKDEAGQETASEQKDVAGQETATEQKGADRQEQASGQKKAEGPPPAAQQPVYGADRDEKTSFGEKSRPKQEPKQNEKQNIIEKIRYTFRRICAKIKELWENFAYYKEVLLCEDTRGLAQHTLMRTGKVLKSIRPRKLRADILFGTGSPDTTGYAFGIYGMFCSWLGKWVTVTPDFERAVLAGELDAAGHITIFQLLWHGLRLVTDRRLRELVDKLRRT